MKKLIVAGILILSYKIGFAQKNFEGEIDLDLYHISDTEKDTTFGDPFKFIIGKNAIKMERWGKNNKVVVEEIVQLDSSRCISIDNEYHVYWISWKGDRSKNIPYAMPWGMNKKEITKNKQKILGFDTYLIRLTNTDHHDLGHVDLAAAQNLYFHLPPQIGTNLFINGELFFDDHIMLKMATVSGVAPHTQIVYQATKIESRKTDPVEFDIPAGYTLTTGTQFTQDVRSGKLKAFN